MPPLAALQRPPPVRHPALRQPPAQPAPAQLFGQIQMRWFQLWAQSTTQALSPPVFLGWFYADNNGIDELHRWLKCEDIATGTTFTALDQFGMQIFTVFGL